MLLFHVKGQKLSADFLPTLIAARVSKKTPEMSRANQTNSKIEYVEAVRTEVQRHVDLRTLALVADDAEVHPQVIRDFLNGKVDTPRGENWEKIRVYLRDNVLPIQQAERGTLTRGRRLVREKGAGYDASMPATQLAFYAGVAKGMAISVRNMLASAVQEQDNLIQHIDSMVRDENLKTPPDVHGPVIDFVTPEELDGDAGLLDEMEDNATAKKQRKTG